MKKYRNIIMLMLFILVATFIGSTVVQASSKTAINKAELTVYVGNKGYLKVTGTDSKIAWKSKNERVATVNQWGTVTGINQGTTTITATVNNNTYTCKVTVKKPYLSSYKVKLKAAETYQLKVIGAAKGTKIKYEIDNTKVATIDQNGLITAFGSGGTNIKVTIGNIVRYSYVSVKNDLQSELKNVKQETFEEKNKNGAARRIYCVVTNNSKLDFNIGFKVTFYNNNNEKVSVNDLNGYRLNIFKNECQIFSFDPPIDREYSYYIIENIEVKDTIYYSNNFIDMSNYVTVEAKEVQRKEDLFYIDQPLFNFLDLEVYNSSDFNINFEAIIKYYKDDKLVYAQFLNKRLDIAKNEIQNYSYINFDYDKFEIVYTARR